LTISSIFLKEMKNLWQKNITFIWQKVDIYFENGAIWHHGAQKKGCPSWMDAFLSSTESSSQGQASPKNAPSS